MKINRRQFLSQCAYLSGVGALGNQFLGSHAFAATPSSEYRAIVQIYLQGGNDMNMIIPNDDGRYNDYAAIRGKFAIDRDQTLGITHEGNNGDVPYGLHPAMSALKSVYDQGDLAFALNVGALVEPINKQEFLARSKSFPAQLFAHNSQTEFVISGLPRQGERLSGWGGRLADSLNLPAGTPPSGISMSDTSLWLRGESTNQFVFASGVGPVEDYRTDRPAFETEFSRGTVFNELNQEDGYDNIFTRERAKLYDRSLAVSRQFLNLTSLNVNTSFPNSKLGRQLRDTATLINSRQSLNQNRQLFFAITPGWDFHGDALNRHNAQLKDLSDSMAAFYAALQQMGVENNVTVVTVSDFGRTMTGNGNNGTDHAWGNNQMVMGGAVDGGKVIGDYPSFSTSDPFFLDSRGVIVPTLSIDQLNGAVAAWFGGLSDAELVELFPNLSNFSQKSLSVYA